MVENHTFTHWYPVMQVKTAATIRIIQRGASNRRRATYKSQITEKAIIAEQSAKEKTLLVLWLSWIKSYLQIESKEVCSFGKLSH